MAGEKYAQTPLMRQFYSIKSEYPDALLLFRAGDFYETFGDDAVTASEVLGITLTKRANGSASSVPLAGFPYHAIDNYLDKLVLAGLRVAICEQLEDPKLAKGIVKRGVTELVTPGVTYNDSILKHTENTFLAAVYWGGAADSVGVSLLDISTGEFYVGEGDMNFVDKVISGLSPKEVLYSRAQQEQFNDSFAHSKSSPYRLDEWAWNESTNYDKLATQLSTRSLKGFGIETLRLGVICAGAILHYLQYTKHDSVGHINTVSRLDRDTFVLIDRYSLKNLELFSPTSEGGSALVDIIDSAISPMGKRMLRRWLAMPLREIAEIEKRNEVVEFLRNSDSLRGELTEHFGVIGDAERIIAKVAAGRATPRDVVQLSRATGAMGHIVSLCRGSDQSQLVERCKDVVCLDETRVRIATTLCGEPALAIGKGMVVAVGVDEELDELRKISTQGKAYLDDLVQRESVATGISSLKIGYNNVFGYFIEVRNTHKDKVPEQWIRKQTLVNAERYITEELKEYEHKILGAEGRILQIESKIFYELVEWLQGWISDLKHLSRVVAEVDVLLSFADTSLKNGYCRPTFNEDKVIDYSGLRHPVIERRLPTGESYIASDVHLNAAETQIILLSGPNMSGKSALLRSVAIASIMAQCGSYVAASSANVMICDKVFTRVGASDNISSGESTFMVEMLETANILNNLSDNSLVILDEIGRGTSTYDGISLAWAIVEHIHSESSAKVLFATHYHELGEMERKYTGIKNFHIAVKEIEGRVIFLRKLVAGAIRHSFGVHVAQMAGVPRSVVGRAKQILSELESQRSSGDMSTDVDISQAVEKPMQLSFFAMDDPTLKAIADEIRGIDINGLTPLEALNKLSDIQRIIG